MVDRGQSGIEVFFLFDELRSRARFYELVLWEVLLFLGARTLRFIGAKVVDGNSDRGIYRHWPGISHTSRQTLAWDEFVGMFSG